jgi:hypothetical protein
MFIRTISFTFLAFFVFQVNAQGMPQGNYSSNCLSPRMSGTTLQADCRNNSGKFAPTQLLNANYCASVMVNNGALFCSTPASSYLTPRQMERFNYCMSSGMGNDPNLGPGPEAVNCGSWAGG